MKKKSFLYLLVCILPFVAFAQWSNNPNLNTKIVDTIGEQILPKVVVNPDNGESYISWFSEFDSSQFDVYLQRLDADGNKLWAEEGLLISNHPTWTWVTNYDLVIDNEGCAVLITQDQRSGNSDVYAYRISPEGEFLWGDDGITLTNDTENNFSPRAVVTHDGNFVFAWDSDPVGTEQFVTLYLQKVSVEGQILWDDDVIISNDTMDLMLPYFNVLFQSEDNSTIIIWVETVFNDTVGGLGGSVNMYPYVQKIDDEGNFVWQNKVAIDTLDNMILKPFMPSNTSDGNSGLFIAWMAFPTPSYYTVYVQHINAEGVAQWTPNGVNVSDLTQFEHTGPVLNYFLQHDELFVFWDEWRQYSGTDVECAVFGQKISGTGERLWTNQGESFTPWYQWLDSAVYVRGISTASDDDFTVFIEDERWNSIPTTHVETAFHAMRIDRDGAFVWEDEKIVITSANSEKSRMVYCDLVNNQWIIAWADNRNDPQFEYETGVYAQNISVDGKLGPLSIPEKPMENILHVIVSPNPATNEVTINYNLTTVGLVNITLLDMNGKLLIQQSEGTQVTGLYSKQLDVSGLAPGIYLIKLQVGNSAVYCKIIKQ